VDYYSSIKLFQLPFSDIKIARGNFSVADNGINVNNKLPLTGDNAIAVYPYNKNPIIQLVITSRFYNICDYSRHLKKVIIVLVN